MLKSEHTILVKALIATPSLSGEEQKIKRFIADWFKLNGVETYQQGPNLLVHLKGTNRKKAFIFNSHMDTVGPGEQEWKYGPWSPTIENKKLIGLGASDMKSGIATSMLYAKKVAKKGKPDIDMWFTYVVNEEVDGSGTKYFVDWFKKKKDSYGEIAAIFTEPTGLTAIEHAHRGNLFLIAKSEGESGHSSRPHDISGKTALQKMQHFSKTFTEKVSYWNKQFPNKYFKPAITLGEMTSIQAGLIIKNIKDQKGETKTIIVPASPNKFASVCSATFDLRTTPDFHDLAEEKVKKLARSQGIKISNLYDPAPAGFTNPNDKLIKIAKSKLKTSKLVVSQSSADLGFTTSIGIKSILLGPGIKKQGHKTNEYCYPEQIPQAVEIYNSIVEGWSGS